jgi:hypothetical protein
MARPVRSSNAVFTDEFTAFAGRGLVAMQLNCDKLPAELPRHGDQQPDKIGRITSQDRRCARSTENEQDHTEGERQYAHA